VTLTMTTLGPAMRSRMSCSVVYTEEPKPAAVTIRVAERQSSRSIGWFMSSSLFSRIWRRIRSPTGYVGKDLDGNRYYEHINPILGGRTRRVVKYRRGADVWEYVSGMRRLPAQWTAWLSHTRQRHPTIRELAADVARIELTRRNAAALEAKAAEERARPLALRAARAFDSTGIPAQGITEPAGECVDPATVSNQELRQKFAKEQARRLHEGSSPWKPNIGEAESWTPRTMDRRG